MRPMLATPTRQPGTPPPGPSWLHEVKWDGMRVLAEVREGQLRLWSRTENDVTVSFPELVVDGLPADALVDGEVVALEEGLPSFGALANRMHVRQPARALALAARNPVSFMAFDLLRLYGVELLSMPLEDRRAALGRIVLPPERWQVPPAYDDGAVLAAATLAQGLEGVVSKRRTSPYRPGRRSPDWVKVPHRRTQTCVVGGWVPQTGSTRIGSLWVGLPEPGGRLLLLGRVGSGLSGRMAADLTRELVPLLHDTCPFTERPVDPDVRRTRWVRPKVVVEVRYLGLREGGRLRQPVLRGMRSDVVAEEVTREP